MIFPKIKEIIILAPLDREIYPLSNGVFLCLIERIKKDGFILKLVNCRIFVTIGNESSTVNISDLDFHGFCLFSSAVKTFLSLLGRSNCI